ncbi:MAG: DUF4340 domain-containing protein [Acidobacteriota bacterium]
MSELQKTMSLAGVAVLLILSALLTAPTKITPDTFLDQGESFFPEFTDPNVATTLEVIEYNEETGSAQPFKVTFQDGRWTIPSHHNYPADGQNRLARTAAGLIEIKKDDYRSNNVADYEAFGVLDPLDDTVTTLKGRGKRVTIKGGSGQVLADMLVGSTVEGRSNLRFVRIPDQKRVYSARVDIDISTRFEDWIDRDLLRVEPRNIQQITLRDYSIDERTRSINQRDVLTLDRSEDAWKANRMSSNQEIDSAKIDELLAGIDGLSIVGVRPKPEGLSMNLALTEQNPLSQTDLLSLQTRGYYFTRDGNLVSNEGELEIRTSEGVVYTLRFGEVLYGSGQTVTAGGAGMEGDEENGPGENRYLFITTAFDDVLFSEPSQPDNTAFLNKAEEEWTDADRSSKEIQDEHDRWQEDVARGRQIAEDLNDRFAAWYYVISSTSFEKVQLSRTDLVKEKEALAL